MIDRIVNGLPQPMARETLAGLTDVELSSSISGGDKLIFSGEKQKWINEPHFELKTFATATDEEIAEMVRLADLGIIDLYEDAGWRVGQTRDVQLSAIAASGTYDGVSWTVGESQPAQTVTLVLMHRGLYQLVNPVVNRSVCSFVVGLKDCMNTTGYMNSTNTNSGSWNGCARRNWCNGGFRQAIPAALRSVFKQFKSVTGVYNGSGDWNGSQSGGTNITSQDYFALAAQAEIAGVSSDYATTNETNALTQFTWYETAANRIKKIGDNGNAGSWWERSPAYYYSGGFCRISDVGAVERANASTTAYGGLSPFGCI